MKLLPVLLLLVAPVLHAQPDDPLKSPACAQALATLDAARAEGPGGARVAALRQQAAQACLGAGPGTGRSARVLQAPLAVPPPVIAPSPPQPSTLQRPPPPVAIDRPALPAHCDAGGCWGNDGGHLRHLGPNPAALGGPCLQQAGQVLCP